MPRLAIRLGHGCHRLLSWECALEQIEVAQQIADCLPRAGFRDTSQFPRVREFVNPHGHSVVVVPSTGRVQLRIHYLTPLPQRESSARLLASQIEDLLGDC